MGLDGNENNRQSKLYSSYRENMKKILDTVGRISAFSSHIHKFIIDPTYHRCEMKKYHSPMFRKHLIAASNSKI